MSEEYYKLLTLREVDDGSEFEISRAKDLLTAAMRGRDYSVVQLLKHDECKFECIVVDVETDGVPPNNRNGIRYKERLALCVPGNPKQLVEVLALRKDFPALVHQNQSPPDNPRSLCLYFEPPASVSRKWTPQSFLRRIQWWLERSATGELHPADQPVEQLFFTSKNELVLPWNFEELRKSKGHHLVIVRGPERPDGGGTCFLEAVSKDSQPPKGTIQPIEFTLPPIVHGHIHCDPTTLGELANLLADRGVEILPVLQETVRNTVEVMGVAESTDDKFSIIILHIPVTRTQGTQAERITHRAFMVGIGALKLGVVTGALFLHEVQEGGRSVKKYFNAKGILGAKPATQWQDEHLLPMEILHRNDTASARKQSGIGDEGPAGVVVGAGSLGSALLNLWGRSGWGQWTVIDKDHIKPHNLVRHSAYAQHIGQPKATVVAELHRAAMSDASEVTPLHADACDLAQTSVTAVLKAAKLVIDASTTLEYPRIASGVEGFGRHVSVFITPNGNAAVLLAEDEHRGIRLRSLEAQYYRALIQETWGQHHLDGSLGSFWSGASCRDISMIMPYSKVMGHAGILAEQIPMVTAHPDALIRVWQRDPERGAIAVHDLPVAPECCIKFGEMDLFIDSAIEQQLRALRTAGFPSETGGVLLGYYDFNISSVTVVAALPAPPDSKSSPGSFERGVEGLAESVREASRRTAGVVDYIGEWHSHPPKHSASPSKADLIQLVDLAHGMSEDGLPAVQLIVGEQDLQILQGTVKE